jgi:hypothetical protein
VVELPHGLPADTARHRRGQLVPRLLRLRFHPRAVRVPPDDPAKPLRAGSSVPFPSPWPRALRPPGPDRALRGSMATRRAQPFRRLQVRRRAAVSDGADRARVDRKQRLRRDRSAPPGVPVADGAHHRRKGLRPPPALRRGRQQHDPYGLQADRRLRGLAAHQPRLPVRGLLTARAASARQQRHRPPADVRPCLPRRTRIDLQRRRPRPSVFPFR